MKIMINNILYAIADALDYVEAELLGATTNHARRVAYISAEMGKHYGLNGKQLLNLAACAVLHAGDMLQIADAVGFVAEDGFDTFHIGNEYVCNFIGDAVAAAANTV